MTYCRISVGWPRSLALQGGCIRRMPNGVLRRCRCVRPARRSSNTTTIEDILLAPSLLLLEGSSPRLDKSILNAASDIRWEYRPRIQRTWDRLFPCFQHLIQLPASLRVDQRVGVHESLIHIPSEKQSVGSAYILHDRVDYIQRRQLLSRWCLQSKIRTDSSHKTTQEVVHNGKQKGSLRDVTYCSNVILQDAGDGHCMFCVFLCDNGQIADLKPVI